MSRVCTSLRTPDGGEDKLLRFTNRLEDEKKRSRYTNTREISLACGAHANLCSCAVSGRSWLVVSAIFSAAAPCSRQELLHAAQD